MKEFFPEIDAWRAAGDRVAIATVVKVEGSAPRPVGATMAVSSGGDLAGSVSGGCVETAVFERPRRSSARASRSCCATASPTRWPGTSVWPAAARSRSSSSRSKSEREPINAADLYATLRDRNRQPVRPVALATIVRGPGAGREAARPPRPGRRGSLGSLGSTSVVAIDAPKLLLDPERSETQALATGRHGRSGRGLHRDLPASAARCSSSARSTSPRRWPVREAARLPGHRHRRAGKLATEERFPEADRIIHAWPDEAIAGARRSRRNTYVAILTHDPKFDEPALLGALATEARYIGAVGSRKTNRDRRERLTERGSPSRASRASAARSGSTSAPTPRRRWRSASWRRSSPSATVGPADR